MVTDPDNPGQSLFAGKASYYARFRPGYPKVFFDEVVQRFHLDGSGRLLDLGCGTGQLAWCGRPPHGSKPSTMCRTAS